MTSVPSITTEQMREVDRLMIEEYGIVLPQMLLLVFGWRPHVDHLDSLPDKALDVVSADVRWHLFSSSHAVSP